MKTAPPKLSKRAGMHGNSAELTGLDVTVHHAQRVQVRHLQQCCSVELSKRRGKIDEGRQDLRRRRECTCSLRLDSSQGGCRRPVSGALEACGQCQTCGSSGSSTQQRR